MCVVHPTPPRNVISLLSAPVRFLFPGSKPISQSDTRAAEKMFLAGTQTSMNKIKCIIAAGAFKNKYENIVYEQSEALVSLMLSSCLVIIVKEKQAEF